MFTFLFYLILIGVSITSWFNWIEESTTFDEAFVGNEAIFPSFTLCPAYAIYRNKSIESFEDVEEEIMNVKMNFKMTYYEFKSYEDPKIVEETFNETLNSNWYFAPRISEYSPYEIVICLIMTPYGDRKPNPNLKNAVSYLIYEIVLNHVNPSWFFIL